jgi:hypothetical protein
MNKRSLSHIEVGIEFGSARTSGSEEGGISLTLKIRRCFDESEVEPPGQDGCHQDCEGFDACPNRSPRC